VKKKINEKRGEEGKGKKRISVAGCGDGAGRGKGRKRRKGPVLRSSVETAFQLVPGEDEERGKKAKRRGPQSTNCRQNNANPNRGRVEGGGRGRAKPDFKID